MQCVTGDNITVAANDVTLTVNGNGDDFTVLPVYNGDTIVCTGNGITSVTSPDCSL